MNSFSMYEYYQRVLFVGHSWLQPLLDESVIPVQPDERI